MPWRSKHPSPGQNAEARQERILSYHRVRQPASNRSAKIYLVTFLRRKKSNRLFLSYIAISSSAGFSSRNYDSPFSFTAKGSVNPGRANLLVSRVLCSIPAARREPRPPGSGQKDPPLRATCGGRGCFRHKEIPSPQVHCPPAVCDRSMVRPLSDSFLILFLDDGEFPS